MGMKVTDKKGTAAGEAPASDAPHAAMAAIMALGLRYGMAKSGAGTGATPKDAQARARHFAILLQASDEVERHLRAGTSGSVRRFEIADHLLTVIATMTEIQRCETDPGAKGKMSQCIAALTRKRVQLAH